MRRFSFLLFLLISSSIIAQTDTIYRSVTIKDIFTQMDRALSPGAIKRIKELTEDSIKRTNPYTSNLTKEYDYYNDSKIIAELEKRHIYYDERYELIAVSYHRYLNGMALNLDQQYLHYDSINVVNEKEYKLSLERDSVDGKYIPLNLVDCFIELDNMLSLKTKKFIEKNNPSSLHTTLGRYIRNRWQLWGGSRLKKYFIDLNGGLYIHPESISEMILEYYQKWLKGDKTAWRNWEIEMRRQK